MVITLLDFIKSRGTSHIKGVLLSNPYSSRESYKILGCSKHRKLGDKKIRIGYHSKAPTEAYLKDYYDYQVNNPR